MRTIDIARVSIELQSPVTIGTGQLDDLVDSMFVADANGLPAIPGTSLAGMLRERWVSDNDEALPSVEEVFGAVPSDRQAEKQSVASRAEISWGHIHDSHNQPRTGRLTPATIEADDVLRVASVPIVRQHVRLNAYGAADTAQRGLFDEAVVAAGHRFTFELAVRDHPPTVLDRLLAILADPATRLGGKSRRGMGQFAIVGGKVRRRTFDLADDYADFRRLPVDIGLAVDAGILPFKDVRHSADTTTITLRLRPRGFWLFGGGLPGSADDSANQPSAAVDIVPYREPRVSWEDERGRLDFDHPMLVVPATGIKGALRHRARFHALALEKTYAENCDRDWVQRFNSGEQREPPEVIHLFGEVPSKSRVDRAVSRTAGPPVENADEVKASAGVILIEDLVITHAPPRQVIQHVSIDRFTSGPLDGHLFGEEALWGSAPIGTEGAWLEAKLLIRHQDQLGRRERTVLARTLSDLISGRLQVGAGSGRGHGWMEGEIIGWPEAWPAIQSPTQGGKEPD
jgi:CRISPR/Cas system CSM-associated protein Csm3 (group 7 of RAMP superfamily)